MFVRTNNITGTHITPIREDYIREIYLTSTRRDIVRVIDISRNLRLARSTVSERIKDLEKARLIRKNHTTSIELTTKGRKMAEHLTYKHRLIEVFLNKTLGISPKKVHEEAHRLEHGFSNYVIARLDKFLENPKVDPHGKIIKKN